MRSLQVKYKDFLTEENIVENSLIKAVVVSSIVLVSGCATILNEDSQKINVATSNGEAIKGSINGVPFEAPGIVSIQRSQDDAILVASTEGCTSQTVVPSSVDPKFFINILSGGAFGSTTDYASDDMWKYENSVTINCK